jgi:hypothetical protein
MNPPVQVFPEGGGSSVHGALEGSASITAVPGG